ncbi:MAG TPA: hypothetical protein VG033_06875 [Candidatus Acidoferrales bacterium]|nr:hypothetical protein [Candidatus Acidoferrales bacterium]
MARACTRRILLAAFVAVAGALCGCGAVGSAGGPPPPPNVTVSVAPTSAMVFLGATQAFAATVTGTTDTRVTWSVNGVDGGNATVGTISSAGLYTAPGDLPSPASVTVRATSVAAPSASGAASVGIESDVTVSVAPMAATVMTGAAQGFTASVSGSGHPDTRVTWSVDGVSGGNATLGTVASTGADTATYTAPSAPPSPPSVSVTATSVADGTKSGAASVLIVCGANAISPAVASVALGQTQAFTATLCVPPGTTITWDVNGIVGGNAMLGTVTNNGGNTTTYTAPSSLPMNNPVTIDATAQTSPPQSASATVTVVGDITVTVMPPAATVTVNQRQTFLAAVANTPNQNVTWSVNGIVNGNTIVGQVCITGSNPCVPPAGPQAGSVDYLAPGTVPATNPVTLVATSQADPSQSGSAQVTIVNSQQVQVTISPPYAFVVPSSNLGNSMLQFSARVTGTSNLNVNWSVATAVPGQGCSGNGCGTVDANGLYTAPMNAPSPNGIAVTATSQADSSQSATAIVAITSGVVIQAMLPSSVTAGAVNSFDLLIEGFNFAPGSGEGASVILVNGAARATLCLDAGHCATSIQPSDVAGPGALTIEVQNPGTPGPLSNPVQLVVLPFTTASDVISLTNAQPTALGKDIVVAEPTTAGSSAPISVNFAGPVTGTGNNSTCTFQGSPIPVTRPPTGSEVVSICVQGTGLDPSFLYAFSGPGAGDIGIVASSLENLYPNLIRLDLTISSTTLAGVRTLFITTLNNDQAVASGLLEVK